MARLVMGGLEPLAPNVSSQTRTSRATGESEDRTGLPPFSVYGGMLQST